MEKNGLKRKKGDKKCFFITPIGNSKSTEFEKLEGLIDNVLNPVLKEKGYELIVAHTIQNLGSINDQIFKNIIEADLIISNLTGLNANVMYETAVAHSFGKPTIMISETETNLPFDLKVDRTIFFDDNIRGTGILKSEIIKKISHLEEDNNLDNPVVRVIESSKISERISKESLTSDETIMKMLINLSDEVASLRRFQKSEYRNINNSKNNREDSIYYDSDYVLDNLAIARVDVVFRKLKEGLGRKPTAEEVAAEMGVETSVIRNIIKML